MVMGALLALTQKHTRMIVYARLGAMAANAEAQSPGSGVGVG
jgi:hypothetical protein